MSEIIDAEILPPDGRDADIPLQENSPIAPRTLDLIEQEDGPYLEVTKDTVRPNLPAIARRYSLDYMVHWDEKTAGFYKFSPELGIWKLFDAHLVQWEVSGLLKTLAEEWDANQLLFKRTPQLINALLALLKGCSPMGKAAPPAAQLLPVENGVLSLSDSTLTPRPYSPDDWFTSKMGVQWNPAAKRERWVNELLRPALKTNEDLNLLQRVLGSMLVAGNPAQCILLLVGFGGSGKSTAVSVFEEILGIHRIAHLRTEKLSTRFETHFFQGKDLLVAKDVGPDFLHSGGSALKWLTGADRFETEKKYGGKFQMEGTLNVIVTANKPPLPKIAGDAEAWSRRMIPIEFNSPPKKRIPNFDKLLLREEGEGILAWLVEGYLAAREEIKSTGFFALTAAQKRRRQDFVDASQSEVIFVRDHLVASNGDICVSELFCALADMCKIRGWQPLTERKFQNVLRELMLSHHDLHPRHDIQREGTAQRGYRGITLQISTGA